MVEDLATWHRVGRARVAVLDVAALPESTFAPFLTATDHADTSRITVPVGRRTAIAARALARSVHAERLGVAPLDVPLRRRCGRCGTHEHGRPYVDHPAAADFSISHTGSLVVLALAADAAVGVDVEELRELDGLRSLRATTLTPGEDEHVRHGPGSASHRYLALWTRKEAAVKLTGEGLSRPFHLVDTLREPVVLDGHPQPIDIRPLPLPRGYVGHLAQSPRSY